MYELNPQEHKRLKDDFDLTEPLDDRLCSVRALNRRTNDPNIHDNYPEFYHITNLMHLAQKFEPKALISRQETVYSEVEV